MGLAIKRFSRRPHAGLLAVVLAVTLVGCQGASSPEAAPVEQDAQLAPSTVEPEKSVVPEVLPANVTARGVVLATVIIATGNVSSAIEQGLISPQEVDLARKAIAAGATQDWIDAADEELRGASG